MAAQTNRLRSLDVFRGLTIALMILVNNPGSWSHVYPPLLHAKWHGLTPTDLVFPFFLIIVGISLYLSFSKFNHELTKSGRFKILKRGTLIFLIGLGLNWFPFVGEPVSELRIMGVLQRIGLSYLIDAFVCLSLPLKQLWKIGALILLAYWGALFLGGGDAPYSLEQNLVLKIDRVLLGEAHLYGGFGIPFDPEGILSSFPAAVTIIFGYYLGALIQRESNKDRLIKKLLLLGAISIFVALCWDIYFPINKALWTSSYVLYTAGIASLVLGILIELIDIRGFTGWTKAFQVFGLNPLIIYVFSGILVTSMYDIFVWTNSAGQTTTLLGWLWTDVFSQITPNHLKLGSFLMALTHLLVCYGLGYWLYVKKLVIKV